MEWSSPDLQLPANIFNEEAANAAQEQQAAQLASAGEKVHSK